MGIYDILPTIVNRSLKGTGQPQACELFGAARFGSKFCDRRRAVWTLERTAYQQLLVERWKRLNEISPVTPWERNLLERARFSIWLEARRNGLSAEDLRLVRAR